MFILDTDHVGILQRGTGPEYSALSRRISRQSQTDLYVTIVSFHEQLLGWNAYIARAKSQAEIVRGYRRMERILSDLSGAQLLPFDDDAGDQFEQLRRQHVRIGTMDLRIAAVALTRNMSVLSRNLVDFERVPGLTVEDWTV